CPIDHRRGTFSSKTPIRLLTRAVIRGFIGSYSFPPTAPRRGVVHMRRITRRDFLQDSAFLSAALAGAGLVGGGRAADKEEAKTAKNAVLDKLRVACVGVRGQGMTHVSGFLNEEHNCIVTTICDVDEDVIGRAMKAVETKQGKKPKYEKDLRKVVEDK